MKRQVGRAYYASRGFKAELAGRIGGKVRRARERRGFSQEFVAGYIGITRSAISNIEAGRGVSIGTLAAIADALGLPLDALVP